MILARTVLTSPVADDGTFSVEEIDKNLNNC